ncbi:MAG: Crp/Fnr family transcriptional regulator, partial [Bacteroidota bacterium]
MLSEISTATILKLSHLWSYMEKLLQLIRSQVRLSEQEKELVIQLSDLVFYPKGTLLSEIGQVPNTLYFVVEGFMRLYQYDDKGAEITNHLNCPPGFITAYADFIEERASSQRLETITDCELIKISKANFDQLLAQSTAMKDFSIWVYQQSLAYNENRARELATLTATERYAKLLGTQAEILAHVP